MAQIVRKDSHAPLLVTEWRPVGSAPTTQVKRAPSHRRLPPSLLGIIGTLGVHAILLNSVVGFGPGARTAHVPGIQVPGSITAVTDRTGDQTLVLLQTSAPVSAPKSLAEDFASLGSVMRTQPIALIRPDPTPPTPDLKIDAPDESIDDPTIASGDTGGYARLFGIYSGQIQARVERIWRRPRTPVTDPAGRHRKTANLKDTFHCQVQIVQDVDGNVQEVLLPRCNGSPAWQRSLVLAINQASPLPAPPDRAVFRRTVKLTFLGLPFTEGRSPDEYEIAAASFAQPGTP